MNKFSKLRHKSVWNDLAIMKSTSGSWTLESTPFSFPSNKNLAEKLNIASATTEPERLKLKFIIIFCLNVHKACYRQNFEPLPWQQRLGIHFPKIWLWYIHTYFT